MPSYAPKHKIRIVTAAALFDGHDASINIMRRILQEGGAEVIHLGHNRSALDVAEAAIQEDAQGIAISSYQGGHTEYFLYIRELLDARGASHIKIFGGGGGVIVPREIKHLEANGISKIFSPEDGRQMGLEGMIDKILAECDFSTLNAAAILAVKEGVNALSSESRALLAGLITAAEQEGAEPPDSVASILREHVMPLAKSRKARAPVLGITGPGGAGKSSLTDELVLRFLEYVPQLSVAVLSVDPSKRKSGGALLGDRIRMNAIRSDRVYMRSLATRAARSELSEAVGTAIEICQAAEFDLIVVESAGTGQRDAEITEVADTCLYVMTSEFGAQSQLEKIEMLDLADAIAINKFERRGSEDALRDVRRQYRRAHKLFDESVPDEELPVLGTIASQFNHAGVWRLFDLLLEKLGAHRGEPWPVKDETAEKRQEGRPGIIPEARIRYLSEVSDTCRQYRGRVHAQSVVASECYALHKTAELLGDEGGAIAERLQASQKQLDPEMSQLLDSAEIMRERYTQDELVYQVRGKDIHTPLKYETLSGLQIPKVALPKYSDWGDKLRWLALENVPGEYPFTAGVFPLKRTAEDPARMFAGEGPPERTNARFHLLAKGQPANRLSTAFDSVTLYGEDPNERPDIYGKVGESGVSVATVLDAERLYAGFDLLAPNTSVSMTINGPAPMLLAFFMNTAIRQACRRHLRAEGKLEITEAQLFQPDESRGASWEDVRELLDTETYDRLASEAVSSVRGTVQADILKEDQAQNTCIFSTEFALRMMGDIQEYFIERSVRNYYSVSISGYHIAEAGANPISQLAFTLANGFTYVQYYLSRGMAIDDFAPNLSFFFSNGLDPEYTVIGRVARRIWAVAMRKLYRAGSRSQKLKYHIQTSGRSLHAMEIDFNDIRTTLQALLAIHDNCNSLHTNAFDEALTTPTDASVRRALAIQMIINKEFGLAKNENPVQGSFIVEELTDLVEEAVLKEFDRITQRGGVLGAMETQYQRGKIQEESIFYERKKHTGELPIVGVNCFKNPNADYESEADSVELRRASSEEKTTCISKLRHFQDAHAAKSKEGLKRLKQTAREGGNLFAELMDTATCCSLGQISNALYEVGGQYRRNM